MIIYSLFDLFGRKIQIQSKQIPPVQAGDSSTLAGMTVDEVRTSVTPASLGLGSVVNNPMATVAEAVAGTANNRFLSTSVANQQVLAGMSQIRGDEGDMLFLDDTSFASLIPGKALSFLSVVTTDTELQTMLNTQEKMADVFNSWKKISRGDWSSLSNRAAVGFSDSADAGELNAFTYDADTDKIKNPRDTYSLVGFICPVAYDNYVLDVILRSDSTWQNDPMGLIVGYALDANGNTHTLSIMRNLWYPSYGTYGAVDVMVDYNTVGVTFIKTQRAGLKWVDGSDAAGAMTNTNAPWSIKPWSQAPNGCRLKVTRAGDTFTVETTQYDETTFVDAAKFSFTLNDHSALAQFKGPQRYGYAAISQDNAIWDVQTRPGARQAVIDIRDKSIREWDGTAWVVNTGGWGNYIKPNRFYYNRTTKRLFYAENSSSLIPIL